MPKMIIVDDRFEKMLLRSLRISVSEMATDGIVYIARIIYKLSDACLCEILMYMDIVTQTKKKDPQIGRCDFKEACEALRSGCHDELILRNAADAKNI